MRPKVEQAAKIVKDETNIEISPSDQESAVNSFSNRAKSVSLDNYAIAAFLIACHIKTLEDWDNKTNTLLIHVQKWRDDGKLSVRDYEAFKVFHNKLQQLN